MPIKQLPSVHMTRHGETGWTFTINFPDREAPKLYRTDHDGQSLYIRHRQPRSRHLRQGWHWKYLLPPAQFSLAADRAAAYQQIRRRFARVDPSKATPPCP